MSIHSIALKNNHEVLIKKHKSRTMIKKILLFIMIPECDNIKKKQ